MPGPKRVSTNDLMAIIRARQPRGLFYGLDSKTGVYVAVDNNSGDAWTEEFSSEADCLRWLNEGDVPAEELYKVRGQH